MPLSNQLRTFLYNVVDNFTIRTCLCRTRMVPSEMSWLSTIIAYDLASSLTKSSSLLFSSATKICNPPRLRVVFLLWILVLLILGLRIWILLILGRWILNRWVLILYSLDLCLLNVLHQLGIHHFLLQQIEFSVVFLIISYRFTRFTIQNIE